MKKLICLLIVVLLASCAHKGANFTHAFGVADRNFPKCEGKDVNLWHACNGVIITMTDGETTYHSHGTYMYGKRDGYNYESYLGKSCVSTMSDGKREGWETCKQQNTENIISKKYYKSGIESQEEGNRIETEKYKQECKSLGFKDRTPDMGNCILKLREFENPKHSNASNPSSLVIKSEPSDAEKLNALNQLLQGVQQVTGGGGQISSPTRTGAICIKVTEQKNGLYKTCVYNCAGTSTTKTVRGTDSCPINTNY